MIVAAGSFDLLYVWRQTTIEGKVIVLLLIGLSILAWAVMWTKAVEIRRARRLNRIFLAEFRRSADLFEIYDREVELSGCPLLFIYRRGCEELDKWLRPSRAVPRVNHVDERVVDQVLRVLERAAAEESVRLESGLVFLAVAVSGAPFLGLLGTVWGVMNAFSGVAQAVAAGNRADLAAMAPGVSGALLTTVAGLLVAIPSMFGYNWLVHNVRIMGVELDNFAEELISRIERELGLGR